jgi:polar amino acid transport system substrate-binding protein
MAKRLVVALTLVLGACGLPKDPDATLERVEGGFMRVGVSHHAPWTIVDGDARSGVEVELVRDLAETLDAEIQWVEAPEAQLMESIELGNLQLAIGGFTADNPWSSRVSFIQPYYILGEDQHVMAVPHGENAWIAKLERFLRSRLDRIPDLYEEAAS